jgi:hypothetical protein
MCLIRQERDAKGKYHRLYRVSLHGLNNSGPMQLDDTGFACRNIDCNRFRNHLTLDSAIKKILSLTKYDKNCGRGKFMRGHL